MLKFIKYVILFSVLILMFIPVMGAEKANYTVTSRIGIGTYHMRSLKNLMTRAQKTYLSQNIPVEKVHYFPAHSNIQLQVTRGLNATHSLGGYLEYASTGSRVDYRDYSGKIGSDMIVEMIGAGGLYENQMNKILNKYNLIASFQLSAIYTIVKTRDYIEIHGNSESLGADLRSVSFGIEHGYRLQTQWKEYIFGIYGGFLFNIGFPLHIAGRQNYEIQNASGDKIKAEWMGLRLALMVGFHQ